MGKLLLSKSERKKAPEIKGKEGQKLLLAILCIVVAIYAVVNTVINGGSTAASMALLLIIFGFVGAKLLMKVNLFKWEYGLALFFSIFAIIGNSVWTIPNMFDLIYDYGYRSTILIEPLIANFVFLFIAILCYNIAFRNAPFKSWTS